MICWYVPYLLALLSSSNLRHGLNRVIYLFLAASFFFSFCSHFFYFYFFFFFFLALCKHVSVSVSLCEKSWWLKEITQQESKGDLKTEKFLRRRRRRRSF